MKRLGIALLLLLSVKGLVSLRLLHGTAVDTYVESIRPGHLLMGDEVWITRSPADYPKSNANFSRGFLTMRMWAKQSQSDGHSRPAGKAQSKGI